MFMYLRNQSKRLIDAGVRNKGFQSRAESYKLCARAAATFLLSFALVSAPAHAQSGVSASLSGTVTDSQGAMIPGAHVVLSNQDEGFNRITKTNGSGAFSVVALPPGNYTVAVQSLGFKITVLNHLVLGANDNEAVSVVLKVAGGSESVTVVDRPSLTSTSGTVATTIDRQFVQELPLDGRSIQSLITLAPGVQFASPTNGNPGQFSVNGMRSDSNYFTVDGVSANFASANYGGSGPGTTGTAGSAPATDLTGGFSNLASIDELQEIQMQTSSFAPEFGRSTGAQISLVTRSGQQQFHGSVYEYFRNDALDSTDWFSNYLNTGKQALRYNDFGGVFGGPIFLPGHQKQRKNTFFFFSYEGNRFLLPQPASQNIVPSVDARASAPTPEAQAILNAFPTPNGAVIYTYGLDPILLGLAPLNGSGACNQGDPPLVTVYGAFPCAPSGGQLWIASWSNPSTSASYGLRLDHHFNDRYSVFARYHRANNSSASRSAQGLNNFSNKTDTLTIGATQVFTMHLLNQFTINASSSRTYSTEFQDTFDGTQPFPTSSLLPASPCKACSGEISILGMGPSFTEFTTIQLNEGNASKNRQINPVDTISYQFRAHQIKAGADFRYISPIVDRNTILPVFEYSGLTGDTLGLIPGSIDQGFPATSEITYAKPYALAYKDFSAFLQDTWRVNQRLTLTYGSRWEFNPPPNGKNGNDARTIQSLNLDTTDFSYLAFAPPGTPLFKTSYSDFAPRLGFAYSFNQVSGWQTTLRGGGGLFYDTGQTAFGANSPYSATYVSAGFGGPAISGYPGLNLPIPAAYATAPPFDTTPSPTNLASATVAVPNYRLPRSYEWNLALDQSLGQGTVFTLNYVASIGKDLQRVLQYSFTAAATAAACAGATAPCSDDFSTLTVITNGAESRYNSLQATLQSRLGRSLEAKLNYTWAHGMDDSSSDNITEAVENPRIDWGNSDYDIRNSFNAALSYNIPSFKASHNFVGAITRDWALNSIVIVRSAPPFNVFSLTTLNPNGGASYSKRADVVPGVSQWIYGRVANGVLIPGGKYLNSAAFANPSTDAIQGDLPRNSLRAFGLTQFNLGVHRSFPIYENLRLQFRAELFNILNHPNFANIDSDLGDPQPGTVGFPLGFGEAQNSFASSQGYSALFSAGGPRAVQLALRLEF